MGYGTQQLDRQSGTDHVMLADRPTGFRRRVLRAPDLAPSNWKPNSPFSRHRQRRIRRWRNFVHFRRSYMYMLRWRLSAGAK